MSEIVRCERCNTILRSAESIKRGMGKTCARIVKLQQANKPKVEPEVNQEIAFIKMEIKHLKRMFKQIQTNGTVIGIERIKQPNPEQKVNGNEANFGSVIAEMKGIFSNIESVYEYLKPVNPIEEPMIPPMVIQVLT